MDPRADKQRAGILNGTAVLVATSVSSEPSADEPSSSPPSSEVEATASLPEAPASQGSVAGRLIRVLTNRSAPTRTSEDR
jgi:hypothetical protein